MVEFMQGLKTLKFLLKIVEIFHSSAVRASFVYSGTMLYNSIKPQSEKRNRK